MHLEWIGETERRKSAQLDIKTRQSIRRRAIQAAALTRQRERDTSQSSNKSTVQTLQPWVVLESVRATTAVLPRSLDPNLPGGPLFQRLVCVIQGQLSSNGAFSTVLSQACPTDEYIRYFVAFALCDTEYLPVIGSHYGRSECLNAAIDCLAARMQQLLTDSTATSSVLRLYARALQLLQKAVINAVFVERFEIYYAIPLLVLFELLNPLDRVAYLTHGRGAVQLLHYIGPDGMNSELNLTILAMQSDVMVIENIRDGRSHCCTDPRWKHALIRAIKYHLPPGNARSEASLTLNIVATALPDAVNHVEQMIMSSSSGSDPNAKEELNTILDGLQRWMQYWAPVSYIKPYEGQHEPAYKIVIAICFVYMAITYRLMVATAITLEERSSAEDEAVRAATEALSITAADTCYDIATKTRLAVVTRIARSITETSREWRQGLESTSMNQYTCQALFTAWCGRIGRMRTATEATSSTSVSVAPMDSETMSDSVTFT